ncbi:MAG: putative RecB family exonuclease [Pseudonocardiales bacterium]|jgi:putative RecB family exonuclease|nr:putative RecB family exonuclease [Pseudonocardiales bacterium]
MTQLSDPEAPSVELPTPVLGSLSPSRAADFKTCPLLYRFRCIDRLPEAPSSAATRGTLVHAVLESLFDLPAPARTLAAARELLPAAWQRVRDEAPEVDSLFAEDADGSEFAAWMDSAGGLLDNYFTLEDPSRLEPESREQLVEIVVDGLRLRGYVDRIDVSPAGDIRVVDYKTGSTPREAFEAKALFQMKFYALVLWRIRGVVPRQLRLMYLADSDTLSYAPDADELVRFERTLKAIWAAIQRALATGDFRPSPSRLCDWCDHKAVCPAWGGTPPPFPSDPVLTDPRDDPPVPLTTP